MSWFKKQCPECQARISFRTFLHTKSLTFACPSCGAQLITSSLGRQIFAAGTGSLFIAVPIMQGFENHQWRWALIPGLALYTVWSYMLLRPARFRRA